MLIIYFNLHYGSVWASSFTQENIESNPGPFHKEVQTSYHHSHPKYADSAGMQCTSTAYISIVFSVIKNIDESRSGLNWGIFLRIKHSLINELQAVYEPLVPLDITTEGMNFFAEIISHESVLLIIIHHYISSHVGATVRYQKLLKIFIRCFYIYFKITNIFIFIRKSQKYIYIVFQNISAIAFFC